MKMIESVVNDPVRYAAYTGAGVTILGAAKGVYDLSNYWGTKRSFAEGMVDADTAQYALDVEYGRIEDSFDLAELGVGIMLGALLCGLVYGLVTNRNSTSCSLR